MVCSPITVMQWVRSRSAPKAGDVVGVQVGVDRLDQLQIELFHELQSQHLVSTAATSFR